MIWPGSSVVVVAAAAVVVVALGDEGHYLTNLLGFPSGNQCWCQSPVVEILPCSGRFPPAILSESRLLSMIAQKLNKKTVKKWTSSICYLDSSTETPSRRWRRCTVALPQHLRLKTIIPKTSAGNHKPSTRKTCQDLPETIPQQIIPPLVPVCNY